MLAFRIVAIGFAMSKPPAAGAVSKQWSCSAVKYIKTHEVLLAQHEIKFACLFRKTIHKRNDFKSKGCFICRQANFIALFERMVRSTGLEPVPSRTRPSNVRVCQFRHDRIFVKDQLGSANRIISKNCL